MSQAPTLAAPAGPAALAQDPLLSAAARLDALAGTLRAEPSRLALWQLLNGAVEVAQVMRTHARACSSPSGVLAAIAAADPAHVGAVSAAWAEHECIARQANALVGAAHAAGEPSRADVRAIHDRASELARRLRTHRDRATWLVYESTLRETGGEG